MIKLSFMNIKGGVGKTSITFQIAGMLSDRGKRVLCVDCDAQNNLTKSFFKEIPDTTLYDVLFNDVDIKEAIYTPYETEKLNNLDVIPSSYQLFNYIKGDPLILQKKLSSIESYYDFCLIDVNPSVSLILTSVLCCLNYIVGVLDLSVDSINGFEFLKNDLIDENIQRINPNLKILGILINNINKNTIFANDLLKHCKNKYKNLLFNTYINNSIINKESRAIMKPLIEYDIKHPCTVAFSELTSEILKRTGVKI